MNKTTDFRVASTDSLVSLLADSRLDSEAVVKQLKIMAEKGLTNNQYVLLLDAVNKSLKEREIMKLKFYCPRHDGKQKKATCVCNKIANPPNSTKEVRTCDYSGNGMHSQGFPM